jgi:hypothetical protein
MPANIHNFEASQIKLHIPCGQEAAYTAKGWNTKFTLQEALDANVIKVSTDNFPWSLSCDSVLTVSGTGAMSNFPEPQYQTIGSIRIAMNSLLLSPFFVNKQKTIKEAIFEEGITYIGNNTFYKDQYSTGSINLTTLTLPSTLTSMSSSAFKGCIALKDVYVSWTTLAAIPTWNQSIDVSQTTLHVPCGTTAFYQAKGWQNFIIREEIAHGTCGAEGDNLTWTLSCDGVLTISGTGAMADYPLVNMPWKPYRESITSVIISDGVTTIGRSAFSGFSSLTSVTIPPSVTSVGYRAFNLCYAMESLYITDLTAWCNIDFTGSESTPFNRNDYSSHRGGGNLYLNGTLVTTLTIPDGITEIKNYAFTGFAGITSIQFNQVTSIGYYAFNSCNGLTSVTIPEGVTTIGGYAFSHCANLQSISIPASISSLGDRMIYLTGAPTDIYVHWTENIPAWPEYFTSKEPQSSITLHVPCGTKDLYKAENGWKSYTVSDGSVSGTCGVDGDNLTWTLCDGVLTISGSGAMANWASTDLVPWASYSESILSVVLADGITSIGNTAFMNCTALTSIDIPNSITSIGVNAFAGCSSLHDITIPNTVASIGWGAFRNCTSLTDFYVSWTETIPGWSAMTNKTPKSDITLHIPCGTEELYNAAYGWKDYTPESEGGPYTITVESDDPSMGTVDAQIIDD